mmetsp:Transcript_60759/g.131767  ORF Transcript_60759/g.131767 Transcript_60759/m.131767 type:complete len:343 (-) Transcript_60759:112-1140(-)
MAVREARDHVRHHRARQAVHEDRDRFLKRAKKQTDWKKIAYDNKDRARIALLATVLSATSMVGYAIMLYIWFRVYHTSFEWSIITLVLLLVCSAVMNVTSQKKNMGRDRAWLYWLSLLMALGIVVATVMGFFLYFHSLAYYWKYMDLRTYTNVAAAQPAFAFKDASMFLWTEDTRLDSMRAVGFKSKFTGQIYCAAPIVDSTMSTGNPIQYWAVGENCCNARAEFHCDDAADSSVRSALVMLEPEEVVRPFMTWAVLGANYPRYERALRLQEATYFTKVSQQVKLVRWSKDPIALRDSYYNEPVSYAIKASLIYFAVLFLLALGASYRIVVPSKKPEKQFRC